MNLCVTQNGLDIRNPFAGICLPSPAERKTRHPVSAINIRKLISNCYEQDDDLLWLVALLVDTGMRLSEAVGLVQDDRQSVIIISSRIDNEPNVSLGQSG